MHGFRARRELYHHARAPRPLPARHLIMDAAPARAPRAALATLCVLFALAACGGGGSASPAPAPPATSSTAVLSVALAGGASPGIDHLWVTVTGLALHADATRVYGDGDPGWVLQTLAAPLTLDLADPALAQGQSVSLLKQSVGALGSYAQLRLLLATPDPNATLAASAAAKGLTFNDQVQVTDASGTHVVPLEIPWPLAGIRLLGAFNLGADATTPLTIEWNAQDSLVRRATADGNPRFTLRNELQLYNQQLLTALGDGNLQINGSIFDSISGQLDTGQFCTGASRAGCIHDVVASATSLSADGRFHVPVRSVNVNASGGFVLYPLPTGSLYDVVIHGGNMETIVVRQVFVDPTGLLRPAPTALSSATTPFVPVLDTGEHAVRVANALAPAGSRVYFGQTVAGSGGGLGGADVPYAIAAGTADPLGGQLVSAVTLPAGPLHDAVFDASTDGNGVPPTLRTLAQAEGLGAWTVWSQGTLADAAGPALTLAAAADSVNAPAPVRRAGFADASLTVSLSGSSSNGADHAELIVANDGGTVAVADVSAQLATHGGTTVLTLPAGSTAAAPAAAVYRLALRTWAAAAPVASARWARAAGLVDLSAASAASAALTLP